MNNLNYYGIGLGLVVFIIIGLFHPLVIKGEYYFGKRIWVAFFALGIVASTVSLFVDDVFISVSLGVLGFSSFWSIKEVFDQVKRVRNGRFPKNPKRKYDF